MEFEMSFHDLFDKDPIDGTFTTYNKQIKLGNDNYIYLLVLHGFGGYASINFSDRIGARIGRIDLIYSKESSARYFCNPNYHAQFIIATPEFGPFFYWMAENHPKIAEWLIWNK